MRGKGEGKKAEVQDVWECQWEGGFTKLALLHAAGLSMMPLMQN